MRIDNGKPCSRRTFLGRTGATAGGLLLGSAELTVCRAAATEASRSELLRRRVLGKTNQPVTTLAIGTSPYGRAKSIGRRHVANMVDEALNLGVNFIDTARLDGNAEEGIGLALGRRRREVFLATKVWADTVADAQASLDASLRKLGTDCVDLLCFHNLGTRSPERAVQPDGVFSWLVQQKRVGKTRFVGLSGCNLSKRFAPFIRTGDVDVLMIPLNFVDRYIYGFEDRVLPLARQYGLGVVATKVFGGPIGRLRNVDSRGGHPQMPTEYLELAVRHALGLSGVAAVSIGAENIEQLRKNVAMVKSFRPLDPGQREELAEIGRRLMRSWGPHFGPKVVDTDALHA